MVGAAYLSIVENMASALWKHFISFSHIFQDLFKWISFNVTKGSKLDEVPSCEDTYCFAC